MRKDISHITQLTRSDFEELARACNLIPGNLVEVDKVSDGIKISISTDQLKLFIYNIVTRIWGVANSTDDAEIMPVAYRNLELAKQSELDKVDPFADPKILPESSSHDRA